MCGQGSEAGGHPVKNTQTLPISLCFFGKSSKSGEIQQKVRKTFKFDCIFFGKSSKSGHIRQKVGSPFTSDVILWEIHQIRAHPAIRKPFKFHGVSSENPTNLAKSNKKYAKFVANPSNLTVFFGKSIKSGHIRQKVRNPFEFDDVCSGNPTNLALWRRASKQRAARQRAARQRAARQRAARQTAEAEDRGHRTGAGGRIFQNDGCGARASTGGSCG